MENWPPPPPSPAFQLLYKITRGILAWRGGGCNVFHIYPLYLYILEKPPNKKPNKSLFCPSCRSFRLVWPPPPPPLQPFSCICTLFSWQKLHNTIFSENGFTNYPPFYNFRNYEFFSSIDIFPVVRGKGRPKQILTFSANMSAEKVSMSHRYFWFYLHV